MFIRRSGIDGQLVPRQIEFSSGSSLSICLYSSILPVSLVCFYMCFLSAGAQAKTPSSAHAKTPPSQKQSSADTQKPASSQAQKSTLPSNEEISARLEKANVLGSHCQFKARYEEEENLVKVMTAKIPDATDKDYKINAVLVGREAMNICGSKLAKVRVVFAGEDGSAKVALIRAGDVKAFGSRLESEDVLLSSIDLEDRHPPSSGDFKRQEIESNPRSIMSALLRSRMEIRMLAARRVEVSKFKEMAVSVKESLDTHDIEKAYKQINELDHCLKEQEELCRAAGNAGRRPPRRPNWMQF